MVYVWSLSVPSWAKVESQTVGVREKGKGEGSVETIPKAFLKLEQLLISAYIHRCLINKICK